MTRDPSPPYQVTFENLHVRIVCIVLEPDQKPPEYSPAAMPMVAVDLNSGQIHYHDSLPEPPDRSRKQGIREIRVELKTPPESPDSMPLDAVRVEPSRYRVEFENDRVRVVRLRFAAREQGVMVSHPPRVLVTLTNVLVKLMFSDGSTDQRGAPAGVAAWLEAETLQTENAAEHPLEVVLIEPKGAHGF